MKKIKLKATVRRIKEGGWFTPETAVLEIPELKTPIVELPTGGRPLFVGETILVSFWEKPNGKLEPVFN